MRTRKVKIGIRTAALTWVLIMTLAPAGEVGGDVWVLPLTAPAFDNVPTIRVSATVGGNPVDLTVMIDTGAGGQSFMTTAAGASVGANGGVPAQAQGVGNAAAVANANLPNPISPSGPSAPVTPAGQGAATPPMPTTTHTVPTLPGGLDGVLGSDWLDQFHYGRIGNYFYLTLKTQGAGGLSDANAITFFLAQSPPVPPGSIKRPRGHKHCRVVPSPDRPSEEGVLAAVSGFDVPVAATVAESGASKSVPFTIATGFERSLISGAVAADLGLDVGRLPEVEVNGHFGPVLVREARLALQVCGDASLPAITVPVGVTDEATNPLGATILGNDVLGRFPYWEVSAEPPGETRFYALPPTQLADVFVPERPVAATTPEPGSASKLALIQTVALTIALSLGVWVLARARKVSP